MLPKYFPRMLYKIAYEAYIIAQEERRNILMSLTVPILWCDILEFFPARHDSTETCFFWKHPSTRRALMGIGETTLIHVDTITRLQAVKSCWNELLNNAIIREVQGSQIKYPGISGPLLFGGEAFDSYSGQTDLWQEFTTGWLVLPTIMVSSYGEYAVLTINQIVKPEDDYECKLSHCIQFVYQFLTPQSPARREFPSFEGTLLAQSDTDSLFLSADEWKQAVTRTVEYIQSGRCKKVMLARGVKVNVSPPMATLNIQVVLEHLQQYYPTSYIFALKRGKRYFCGATPELLVQKQRNTVNTMALASSLPRGATEVEDHTIEMQLLHSAKHLEEHALVVTTVLDILSQICSEIKYETTPSVLKLENIQHLLTPISGQLLSDKSILDVIMALHPTPAVGGIPYHEALNVIHEEEKLDRGWYASPIGWLDFQGNGEFVVALRCALLDEHSATLFAGCGIVAGSKAEEEYQETDWKLQVIMNSLRAKREAS